MHEKFHYKTLDEIKQTAAVLGVSLPFAADTHALAESLRVGTHVFPNRLGIAPMEGADSLPDGSPSDFTARRYLREAKGGSAIIWFEAISIVPEGRSSATQLYLCRENLDSYKRLTQAVKEAGLQANGFAPYLVMQANHSGRYSNPDNKPAPTARISGNTAKKPARSCANLQSTLMLRLPTKKMCRSRWKLPSM